MAKIPLIIDCDPGHDDAIALMLAASASDVFDLRAVTTVGGAQSVDKTFYNARRVLTVIGLDVPVARGAAQPMVRKALGIPIIMSALDVTHKAYVTREENEVIRANGNRCSVLAAELIDYFSRYHYEVEHLPGCTLHDPCAVASLL